MNDPIIAPVFDVATLPEELRSEPSLATIKTIPDLAKSYVSSQKLIGINRLPEPQQTWGEKEWGDLYNKLGRPETPDAYELPKDIKLPDGVTLDAAKTKTVFAELHKLGLSKKQTEGVMRQYLGSIVSSAEAETAVKQASFTAGVDELKKTHGDKFEAVVGMAKGVLARFGGDELLNFITQAKLDSNPMMVNFLYKMGQAMSEDTMRSGGGVNLPVGDAAQAQVQLRSLEADIEFQKAYNDRMHAGHQDAVDRTLYLNRIAYPGKIT